MPNSIIKSFAKKYGKTTKELEDLWDKAARLAIKKGIAKDSESMYAYTTGILKRMLKKDSLLLAPSNQLLESYLDGTSHRLRAEPIGSASTIFKRDKFLRRRHEKDKKKIISKKTAKKSGMVKGEEE